MQNWEKIRHEIKPEITYSYIPNVSQDNIPDYLPIASPFLMPSQYIPEIRSLEQNAVAWSLTNTFMAKIKDDKGAYSYLEFLRLKLFQTYDINEAKKGMDGIIQ